MIVGSVCSGIEAASVAWEPLGWRFAFLSEIEPFPRAVLAHHYPEVTLRGDFTAIQSGDHEPIDILVGGTPCQSFSVAGLRGGMADERGNLALEYLRLADRLRPRWLVWENVPGVRSSNKGRDFGAFLGGLGQLGYGWAYRSLDSQYFGLAQRRERVFVVGCLGDWRRAGAVLFEPASLRGDSAPGRKAGEGVAGTIEASFGRRRCGQPNDHDPAGGLIASALRSRDGARGVDSDCTDTLIAFPIERGNQGGGGNIGFGDDGDPCFTLQSSHAHATATATAVRRLTPRECCRLQGFPDDYLDITYCGKPAADGPKYKALGNSFAVPCMAWIGRRIADVESAA
jgi:DNA (cytosine-5)-methyltransferase 1